MKISEWNNIRAGDTIYTMYGGNPRYVKTGSDHNKSRCIILENDTVYCSGDKYLFTLIKPIRIRKKVRKIIRKVKKFLLS